MVVAEQEDQVALRRGKARDEDDAKRKQGEPSMATSEENPSSETWSTVACAREEQ
jgi:hypothetical protein